MASNSHPDVVFVFCLAVFRKTRPSKRVQKQPRHVLHWSHKDLTPTNYVRYCKIVWFVYSYNSIRAMQPLQVGKTAEVPVIDVKSSAGKSWKRRRYNALVMSRQKKLKTGIKGRLELELYSPKLTSNTSRSILKTILKQV